MYRPKDVLFIGRCVEPAAGGLNGGLPDRIGDDVAELPVQTAPDEIHRDLRGGGVSEDVGHRLAADADLCVLTVAEDHHGIAGRVEKVERLEEIDRLLDGLADRRALIRKLLELGPVTDKRRAQQDVGIVIGKRRDDVRLVAEFNQRDQIAVLAVHPLPDERLGRRDGGEEKRPARCVGRLEPRGVERCHHARGGVDHQRDSTTRIRDLLLREGGIGPGEGQCEKRKTGEEQYPGPMPNDRHRRGGRRHHDRGQRDLVAAGSSPCGRTPQHQGERCACQKEKNIDSSVTLCEEEIVNAQVLPGGEIALQACAKCREQTHAGGPAIPDFFRITESFCIHQACSDFSWRTTSRPAVIDPSSAAASRRSERPYPARVNSANTFCNRSMRRGSELPLPFAGVAILACASVSGVAVPETITCLLRPRHPLVVTITAPVSAPLACAASA